MVSYFEIDQEISFIRPDISKHVTIHDENFHSNVVAFRREYIETCESIVDIEKAASEIAEKCKSMEDIVRVSRGLSGVEWVRESIDNIVSRFKEDENIVQMNVYLKQLHEKRLSMLKTIQLFVPEGVSLCALCFENQVTRFSIPCGHATCQKCDEKANGITCSFCRSNISGKGKLFLNM